jgi:hypothetical protein
MDQPCNVIGEEEEYVRILVGRAERKYQREVYMYVGRSKSSRNLNFKLECL